MAKKLSIISLYVLTLLFSATLPAIETRGASQRSITIGGPGGITYPTEGDTIRSLENLFDWTDLTSEQKSTFYELASKNDKQFDARAIECKNNPTMNCLQEAKKKWLERADFLQQEVKRLSRSKGQP